MASTTDELKTEYISEISDNFTQCPNEIWNYTPIIAFEGLGVFLTVHKIARWREWRRREGLPLPEPPSLRQFGSIGKKGPDTATKYLRMLEQFNIIQRIPLYREEGGQRWQYGNEYRVMAVAKWLPPDTVLDPTDKNDDGDPPSGQSTPGENLPGGGKKPVGKNVGGNPQENLGGVPGENLGGQLLRETSKKNRKDTAAAAMGHSASAPAPRARPKASPAAEGVAAAAKQAETIIVTTTTPSPATSTPAPLVANALAATMQGGLPAQIVADAIVGTATTVMRGESEGGPSLEEMLGWSDEDEGQAASPPTGTEAPPAAAGASPGARAETPDEHRQKYTESLDDATRETLRAMCAKLKGYKGFSNRVVIDLFEATGMDLMRQGADVLAATAEFCGTYGREGRGCTKGTPTAMLMGFWRRRTSAMFTPPARTGEKGGGRKGGERQYTPLAEAGVATNAVSMDVRMAAWKKAQAGTGVSIPTP